MYTRILSGRRAERKPDSTKLTRLLKAIVYLEIDPDLLRDALYTAPKGVPLLVTIEQDDDCTQKRRFFEGPVLDAIRGFYRGEGVEQPKALLREKIKLAFLGAVNPDDPVNLRAVSTTDLTEQQWNDFLSSLRRWCRDRFGQDLPEPQESEAENVDS